MILFLLVLCFGMSLNAMNQSNQYPNYTNQNNNSRALNQNNSVVLQNEMVYQQQFNNTGYPVDNNLYSQQSNQQLFSDHTTKEIKNINDKVALSRMISKK